MSIKKSITGAIEEVRYNGGHSTRKPSTVTMAVDHKFAVEVAELKENFIKKGIEPEKGLLRLELIAVYSDPDNVPIGRQVAEKMNEDINESVKEALENLESEKILDDLELDLDEASETLEAEEEEE